MDCHIVWLLSVEAWKYRWDATWLAANSGAQIGLPELDLGVPAWGQWRLTSVWGENHAIDMILRAKKISGERALDIGLVHEIWPLADLKKAAHELAQELASMPAVAVRSMLGVLVNSADRSLSELLKAEREAVHTTRGTSDSKEGMMAFSKRENRFLIVLVSCFGGNVEEKICLITGVGPARVPHSFASLREKATGSR